MIGLFISVMIVWLVLEVLVNYGFIEAKSALWHTAAAWNRGVLSLYMAILVFKHFWLALSVALCFNSLWWILFDLGLNLARRESIFYIGSSGIDLAYKSVCKRIGWDAELIMLMSKILLTSLCTLSVGLLYHYYE